MKLTTKKTIFILVGEVVLAAVLIVICLIDYYSIWSYGISPRLMRIKNMLLYDEIHILNPKPKESLYFNLKMLENPDGTFSIFSSKCEFGKKTDNWFVSVIRLDNKLQMIGEKRIPGFMEIFPISVNFAGDKYYLISPIYGQNSETALIRILSKEGNLLSEKTVKRTIKVDFNSDGFNALQYIIRGKTGYIFYDDTQNKRLILSEIDLDRNEVIKDYILPSDKKIFRVTQPVTDPRDSSLYIAGTNDGKQISIWKLDNKGSFSRIINQALPDSVSITLCMDDKPYLLTSTLRKDFDNATLLTAYGINGNKLDKLWTYKTIGNGLDRLCGLKTKDNWYVSDVYREIKNPHAKGYIKAGPYYTSRKKGTVYYSSVMKFDSRGKFISQSKYAADINNRGFQLLKTTDERIVFTGTTQEILYGGRPFVAEVR